VNEPFDASAGTADTAYALTYLEEITEHESNYVVIDARGNVTSFTAYTQTGMTPRALGWHYLSLGHGNPDLAALGTTIREMGLIGGQIHKVPPMNRARTKTITLRTDGRVESHFFLARNALPAGFDELEKGIRRLHPALAEAPLRALVLSVSVLPVRAASGDSLKVRFDFGCLGKFPLDFRNPAHRGSEGGFLKINLWRRGTEPGEGRPVFAGAIDIAREELRSEEGPLSVSPFLRIPPGGKLALWTTVRVPDLAPGPYLLEAIYYGYPAPRWGQQKHPDLVAGELHADLQEIVVSGTGR